MRLICGNKVLSVCALAAWAYDFSAVAPTGQTLYYTITSDSTVEVSGNTTLTGSLTIPSTVVNGSTTYSVTSIGDSAFFQCSGLTSVTIPHPVANIGYRAFLGCSGITTIDIPNSMTSIGTQAFEECSGLTHITIPNSVTSIGKSAFYKCSSLTSVTIPNSVTNIGNFAFAYCSSLTSVDIPNSVTSIGYGAFAYCSSLSNVNIPNSVTDIGVNAFCYCDGLTDVIIPNSVTNIGDGIFAGCSGFSSLVVENGNSNYDSRENCNAIIETASNTMIAGTNNTFIPNSVTGIGIYVFEECFGLTHIAIPNSVTSIGEGAFYNCSGLTSVNIDSGVTTLDEYAFYGCDHLDTIICNVVEPPTVADTNAFTGVWKGLPLIVPGESVGQYQSAYGWRDFTNIIGAPIGIEEESFDYKVYANNGCIAVSGAEGQTLRIYDVQGRLIVSEKAEDNKLYAVPTTGVYMVQVGKNRAQKVMVAK